MKKNILIVLGILLGFILTSCGWTDGLPLEAEKVAKEEIARDQNNRHLKPISNDEIKIFNSMKSPSQETGYDEAWCGNFSPALSNGLNTGEYLSLKCTKETPCEFTTDGVYQNVIVVHSGSLWTIFRSPMGGASAEDFRRFSCTNWANEYDMSDRTY